MTRIVAGTLGGRRIAAPPGAGTRPTSDRVREALFSAVQAEVDLAGARFADLYAGSGAVGLEALSRGAAHVLLVESDPRAARVIRENIGDAARRPGRPAGHRQGRHGAGGRPGRRPVRRGLRRPAVRGAGRGDRARCSPRWSTAAGWPRTPWWWSSGRAVRGPVGWVQGITGERSRRYGETTLWYGRRS